MVTLPMDLFNMGGLEFGISFVTREETLNDLRSIAGQHGFKLIFAGKTDDEEIISVLSRKDEEDKHPDINGFLTIIRKQDCWVPDMDKFEDYRVMIFYHREVLS